MMEQKSLVYKISELVIVGLILVTGCVYAPNQNKAQNKRLTTTISPARDLSGNWEGIVRWSDTITPDCKYEMIYLLSLSQKGNSLSGSFGPSGTSTTGGKVIPGTDCMTPFQAAIIDPFIQGTVSAATFEITAYDAVLSGTFTTDLMQGTIGGQYTGDFSFKRK